MPEDPSSMMEAELVAETRDVMLVGHIPNIAGIAARLAKGDVDFPLHGAVCFERVGDREWKERWRLT